MQKTFIPLISLLIIANIGIVNSQTLDIASISDTFFCTRSDYTFSVLTSGSFNTGNEFSIQLSDEQDSFNSPTTIGRSLDSASFVNITCVIPAGTESGSGYRMRAASTDPSLLTIENANDLTVYNNPTFMVTSDFEVCPGQSIMLYSQGIENTSWTPASLFGSPDSANTLYFSEQADTFYLATDDSAGCIYNDTIRSIVSSNCAAAPGWEWAKSIGSSGSSEYPSDMVIDLQGNIYVASEFSDTLSIGTFTLYPNKYDHYVAKFDPNGDIIWLRHLYDTTNFSYIDIREIKIDPAGFLYVYGEFAGTLLFDGQNLLTNTSGFIDVFLAKYDLNGNLISVVAYGGPNQDFAGGIDINSNGDIIMVGYFPIATTLGTINLTGTINNGFKNNIFLAKVNTSDLSVAWAVSFGGEGDWFEDSKGTVITLDASDNIYLGGIFWGALIMGSDTIQSWFSNGASQDADIFFAKLDPVGTPIWLKYATNKRWKNEIYSIILDSKNNVIATGHLHGETFIGSDSLDGIGVGDVFLVKFTNDGQLTLFQRSGTSNNFADRGYDLAIDNADNLYITGNLTGGGTPAYFSSEPYGYYYAYPPSSQTSFVVKYNPDGVLQWHLPSNGDGSFAIAYNKSTDEMYILGFYQGTEGWGPDTLTSPGGFTPYIAKIGQPSFVSVANSTAANSMCPGDNFNIDVISTGNYNAGNDFIIEISDAIGNFTNNDTIGQLSGTSGGTVFCALPGNLSPGNKYRLRITSTDPFNILYPAGEYNVINCGPTSITENPIQNESGLSLRVFPNPTSGIVTLEIDVPEMEKAGIKILNILSQEVRGKSDWPLAVGKNTIEINIQGYQSGIYFLRVTSKQGIITKKIIIQ